MFRRRSTPQTYFRYLISMFQTKKHSPNLSPLYNIYFSDEEALPEPHQAADERLHGLLPHRAKEDCRGQPGHSQCGDLQAARQEVGVVVVNYDEGCLGF